MAEQEKESAISLLVEGIKKIREDSRAYADHEDKRQPAYFRVFKRIGPFKKKLLKVYHGKDVIEIESKQFSEVYLKEVFSRLETLHPEIKVKYKTD